MKNNLLVITIIFACSSLFSCSKERRSDKASVKMQKFVCQISTYARSVKPGFIIIPQNGIELAFNNNESSNGINQEYTNAIDGFGVEELFFNGTYQPDFDRLPILKTLKEHKKIMVSEFVNSNLDVSKAFELNNNEGFICFVRQGGNYDYIQIPDSVIHENSNDITKLSDAKNFLYLINTQNFASKQAFIDAVSKTNYDLILMDLFFDEISFTAAEIARLKIKSNGAKRLVISYISIGSAEKFRYYWKKSWGQHHPLWLKRKYQGYKDEFWLKFWKQKWQDIIYGNDDSYIRKIIDAGFDGAYLDNVEAYYFLYYKD